MEHSIPEQSGKELIPHRGQLPAKLEDLQKAAVLVRAKKSVMVVQRDALKKIGGVDELWKQKQGEASDLAELLLDIEVRMGTELNKKKSMAGLQRISLPEGITPNLSSAFQKLAAHIGIVENEKIKARRENDLPTRTAIIREIDKLIKGGRSLSLVKEASDFRKILKAIDGAIARLEEIEGLRNEPVAERKIIASTIEEFRLRLATIKDGVDVVRVGVGGASV